MKLSKIIGFIAILSMIVCVSASAVLAAVDVSIDSTTVDSPGNTATVNITAHNVTELGIFGIMLEYDTSIVSVTGVQNSPDIPDGFGLSNTIDDGSLSVVSSGMTIPSLTGAEVLLVTVTLEAVGDAGDESDLNITTCKLQYNNGTDIDATDVDGTFGIAGGAVSEPTCTVSVTNTTITPPQTTGITMTFSEKVQYTLNIETSDGTVVRDWSGDRKASRTVSWNGTYTDGTQVPDGTYTVNLTVTNETTELSGQNRTETIVVSSGGDTTSPVITDVACDTPTTNSVNITWTTGEDSNSLVKYGTVSGTYTVTIEVSDIAMTTSHSIMLTGLDADTDYYFVVNSTDASDNSAESGEHSFKTSALEGPSQSRTYVSIESVTVNSSGNTATVNITAHNVTELGIFGIMLEYDTSIVSVTGVQNSPDIPDGFGLSNTIDDGSLSVVSSGMTIPSLTGAEVLLVTVTLEAVGDAGDESDLNITTCKLQYNNGTDIDATDVDGTFGIAGGAVSEPTCTVSVTNTTITPPQTTGITMTFSEKVQYTLNIETSDGTVVRDWSGDRKTSYTVEWNGTYEIDGTQIPDGTYTVNLTVTNETTGLSGQNRTETITVGTGVSSSDTTPPSTSGHDPASGATGVPINTSITVHVLDDGVGVNISTIVMTVNGTAVTPNIVSTAADCIIVYTPSDDFGYDQLVNVTINASDLNETPNVMTTDAYSFTTESATVVDNTPPSTSGHDPARDAASVPVDTNITVHVLDDGDGVNNSTIVMTVNDTIVTPDITGTAADYTVVYTPSVAFDYEQLVNVTIDAADLNETPNVMTTDAYSFTTESATVVDNTPPSTSGYNPARDAASVPVDTNITVHVLDDGAGVNNSTIVMTVNGTTVTPDITGTAADYTVVYTPPADFDYEQLVNVTINASDLNETPNVMTTDAYSFTTESATVVDNTPPSTSGHDPARDAASVPVNTNITVHVLDDGAGVDNSTIVMTVNGADVYLDITGTADDYTVVYTPPDDFGYNQLVNVTINASDLNATPNVMTTDGYSFTTGSAPATSAPTITSSTPTSPANIAWATREFSIEIDQTVNVTWLINGSEVQTNESVTAALYTNTSAEVG
ncbi:MAG: FlgD immunoglobulin-like domain containing protein, partial [Euryarchaeota archaeon]|nr:FlgD immunoglobulin-like domain containing protein [Euryarchaeota archaeon]